MAGAPRRWGIRYRAHNGLPRPAVVLVPAEYSPENPPSPLPLVISPHGRGIRAIANAQWWRDLPARGGFAVICPAGMGRRLPLHSWGWRGQIADLARMPSILQATMPWLRVDRRRVYAVGGSMGGQEDAPAGRPASAVACRRGRLRLRSRTSIPLPRLRADSKRSPVAGARSARGRRHAEQQDEGVRARSPTHWVREVARAGVPLQLWWSDATRSSSASSASRDTSTRSFVVCDRAGASSVRGSWPHTGRELFTAAVTRCGQVAGPARAVARLSARSHSNPLSCERQARRRGGRGCRGCPRRAHAAGSGHSGRPLCPRPSRGRGGTKRSRGSRSAAPSTHPLGGQVLLRPGA
jgi:hypothetical protein